MTTNRTSLIIAVCVIAALAVLTISMLPTAQPAAPNASINSAGFSLAQRQGEWTAGVTAEQAYLDQRRGEQDMGPAPDVEQAYLVFRQGEWYAGVNADLVDLNFRRGEWAGQ